MSLQSCYVYIYNVIPALMNIWGKLYKHSMTFHRGKKELELHLIYINMQTLRSHAAAPLLLTLGLVTLAKELNLHL